MRHAVSDNLTLRDILFKQPDNGALSHVAQFGSVTVIYFREPPVENYMDVLRNRAAINVKFRGSLVERGTAAMTLEAADDVMRTLGRA